MVALACVLLGMLVPTAHDAVLELLNESVRELVEVAAEVTGQSIVIETQPDRGFDVRRIVLDIGVLQAMLPFEPTSLREGVTRTWRALQGQ